MKRILPKLLIGLIILVVALFLCRNFIARKSVEVGVAKLTGFPLEIGSVNLGIFSGTLEVQNLKLMNPPEFKEKMFVDLPLLKIDYRTMSMLGGSPHIKELIVNVEQVVLVTNAKGEINAQVLQAKVTPASTGSDQNQGAPPGAGRRYTFDLIRVHIGTVKQNERMFTLNRDVEFRNVTEATSITALVMNTVFGQVGDVAGVLVKGLGDVTKGATDTLQKTGKGAFDKLKQVVPQKK